MAKHLILPLILAVPCFALSAWTGNLSASTPTADSLTQTGNSANNTANTITILFFGDSITAGYGLSMDQAYPAIIQNKADSLSYEVEVINGGVSGETSAGGLRRVDWILQRPIDLFVLALGGNDGLRGIDPGHTRDNLQKIIDKVIDQQPTAKIVLAGMEAPPNLGDDYTRDFRNTYRDLVEHNDVIFIPFLLEGVAGEPELNLEDGIHPTAEGHRVIASHVWDTLEPMLHE